VEISLHCSPWVFAETGFCVVIPSQSSNAAANDEWQLVGSEYLRRHNVIDYDPSPGVINLPAFHNRIVTARVLLGQLEYNYAHTAHVSAAIAERLLVWVERARRALKLPLGIAAAPETEWLKLRDHR
jgi:hypothetical protein